MEQSPLVMDSTQLWVDTACQWFVSERIYEFRPRVDASAPNNTGKKRVLKSGKKPREEQGILWIPGRISWIFNILIAI